MYSIHNSAKREKIEIAVLSPLSEGDKVERVIWRRPIASYGYDSINYHSKLYPVYHSNEIGNFIRLELADIK